MFDHLKAKGRRNIDFDGARAADQCGVLRIST